jgi:hypothetical protein
MRKYLLLEFLQDNEGYVYAFIYDRQHWKCFSVPFWAWLDCLSEMREIEIEGDEDE